MGRTATGRTKASPPARIRKPARCAATVETKSPSADILSRPWGPRPTLGDIRALAAAIAGFDAAPVTIHGREGIVATLPSAGQRPLGGMAYVLVEGPDGRPVLASTPVSAGTGFADALDMALMQYIADPGRDCREGDGILPFVGDEPTRTARLAAIMASWPGDPEQHAHLASQIAARVSRAIRAARVTPRFRTALMALDASRGAEVAVFRRNEWGDRTRAALVGYPLAALQAGHHGAERDGIAGLTESIARDRPGFAPAHLRRIGGPAALAWYRSAPVAKPSHWRLPAFFDLVAAVPPEWLPTDESGLHAFDACAAFLLPVRNASGQPLRQLVAPSRGDWHAFHAALTRDPWAERMRSHIWTAAEDLGVRVLLPIAGDLVEPCPDPDADLGYADIHGVRDAAKEIARQALYGGKSAIGVLETAKRLYALQPTIQAGMPHGAHAPALWAPLFGALTAPNGLTIVSLASAQDMADEGAPGPDRTGAPGLDHCVAASVPSAAEGYSFFLSVRRCLANGGYERLSTVQLVLSDKPGASNVYQHRGRSNAPPPPEAVEAVAWMEGIRPYTPWRAHHRRRGIGSDHNLVAYECHYDWRDGRLVEAALDAWRPGLPRRLARLDVAGLRAALDLDAALAPALDARRANRLWFSRAR